jgi:hypothetical protein
MQLQWSQYFNETRLDEILYECYDLVLIDIWKVIELIDDLLLIENFDDEYTKELVDDM